MGNNMRWLEDDLNDDSTTPYREGKVYICRNCACQIDRKLPLCRRCLKLRNMQEVEAATDEAPSDD